MRLVSEWVVVRIIVMCVVVRALAQPVSSLNDTFMTKGPNCPYRCSDGNITSNITIPYPFGIGDNCALNDAYVIACNNSFTPPRPFIREFGVEVLEISLENGYVGVNNPPNTSTQYLNLSANSSLFSHTYTYTSVLSWRMNGFCTPETINTNRYCGAHTMCYGSSDNQYNCMCNDGYEGNPYIGCQDINECKDQRYSRSCRYGCENINGSYRCIQIDNKKDKNKKMTLIGIGSALGALLFILGVWWTYKSMKRRRKIKIKEKFFIKNGGLLLQQQLSSGEEGNVVKTELFTSKELEKATDNYNKTRILGHGGQGTVYKGMLADGRIVAIKMSNEVDEGKLEEFINEVVILLQINHRNVVKLHGCCLETEVPLLVYEFIPNGTLFHYIHDGNEDFLLSWHVRLRIVVEVASALAYLHSAASKPIYHRDIKSTNILLDDKYRAKVADFGTSKSIAIDQTHCTTRVQGTMGYLDPEYYQSSQFTDKSDVYSFGVVLVELLTCQKPISSTKTNEGRSLVMRFILAMKENRLLDILDARILNDRAQDEIIVVANIAKNCLNLSGKKRPSMKEVAMELERIIRSKGAPTVQKNYEEVEYVMDELVGPWEATSTSTGSYIYNSVSLEINPLL